MGVKTVVFPDGLPPSIVGNDPSWPLLLKAHKKLERLDAISSQLPDISLIVRPLQRREALNSNSLEGTVVSPTELLLFELKQNNQTGDENRRDDWLKFCLAGTIQQATDSLHRCHTLQLLKKKYHEKLSGEKALMIVDDLFRSPIITVGDVQKKLGVTYHTSKKYLERLRTADIITELQDHRPRTYVAFEVFDAAHGD